MPENGVEKRGEYLGVRQTSNSRLKNGIMKNFVACTLHQILIRIIKLRRMRWVVQYVAGIRSKCKILIRNPEDK
jgi:hypothetical protein